MNQRLLIVIIGVLNMASPFALHIFPPAAPFVRRELDLTVSEAQWSVTAFAAFLAIAMIVFGPLADRYDRKRLVLAGSALFSAGCIIAALAPNVIVLVVGRSLQAVGAASASVVARSIAATVFDRSDFTRVFSYINMIIVIAPMFAPLIAGFMIDGLGWRSLMWLLLGVGVVMIVSAQYALKGSAPNGDKEAAPAMGSLFSGFGVLFRKPMVVHYFFILFVAQGGIFAFLSAAPYIMVETLGRPASEYGLYFVFISVGFLLGSFAAARFSSTLGADRIILFAVSLYGIGALLLFFVVAQGWWHPMVLFGVASVFTTGNGAIQPAAMAGTMAEAIGHEGAASSLTGFGLVMSGAIGLQVMGYLQGETPIPVSYVIIACAIICVTLMLNLQRLRSQEHAHAET